uniref:Branched-chain-amino-acid aminotransferase n=1 Tax=uncultured bacterium contig00163 TaxID=1181594 RepID=A0A806KL90_9BACT|nr:branched-chain amino acid aminotransferase [uncultured bacterium contig00163]
MAPSSTLSESGRFELQPAVPSSDADRAAKMQNPGFGRFFTDNMVAIPYKEGEGWGKGCLKPYGNISIDPAGSVLHYGQAIFEGFKAYHQPDGGIIAFRIEANAHRFNASAKRLAMPDLPIELFIEAAELLIAQERAWVPKAIGESLYLRPFMIGTEAALGIRPSREYLFVLIASPAGAYFPQGVKPVTVWISEDYVRAAPGGTGYAKCSGNYAGSLIAQIQAKNSGCDQVVWIDAVHRKYVEEMGGMNIFFVYEENGKTMVVTPALTDTLLPGITRLSLLEIAKELGYGTDERRISIQDWESDLREGRMTEAFACGTAAVITPIGTIKSAHGTWTVNQGQTGPVTSKLRETLLNIQHGLVPDTHGWLHKIV